MKKIYFFAVLLFGITLSAYTQGNVGIGTNTPSPSAKLDIDVSSDATKSGLLIPRVDLTATNLAAPISSPATSLLVYNTATDGTAPNNVTPGYYYWDGAKWVKFMVNNNNTIDLGYILGWSSNTAPPDYLLPLNGGTYNWSNYPDFQSFNTSYPCQFIASSTATTFTLVNINTSKRFLRGNTSAGVNEAANTGAPTAGNLTVSTTGAHIHSVDPPSTTTNSAGAHDHGRSGTGSVGNNNWGLIQQSNGSTSNTVSSTDKTSGEPNIVTSPRELGLASDGAHTHTVDIAAFNSASAGDHTHTLTGWDTETRPLNTSVIWCIKVKPTATSGTINITNTANTAINGLSVYGGGAIGMGGNLNQATTVNQAGNNFAFDGTGNVGIGTSTPANKLAVNGTIQAIDNGAAGTPNILIGDDAFLTDLDIANTTGLYGQTNNALGGIRLGSNAGSLIWGEGGNIGIGSNATPQEKLHVAGNIRSNSLAGTGVRPVYSDANGTLTNSIPTGQVINMVMANITAPFPSNITVNSTAWTNIATYSYTRKSNNSTIIVEFDAQYEIVGGATDSYRSRIIVGGTQICENTQRWNGTPNGGGGTRSGTILPIMGGYDNSATGAITINIDVQRDVADDDGNFYRNSGTWMKITEVAK